MYRQVKRKRAERARRYADAHPEHAVSVEIMCIALARFRTSERWQELGAVGRWAQPWIEAWRKIGRAFYRHSPNIITLSTPGDARNFGIGMRLGHTSPTLQSIYKQPYETSVVTAIDQQRGIITLGRRSGKTQAMRALARGRR